MNNLGDYSRGYFGVGSETAPSETFGNEPVTGVYLDTPGTSSAYTITKRGRKRVRVSDTETTFYDPVIFDGGTSSSGVSFPDGSELAPSITFTAHTTSGMYYDTTIGGPGIASGGGELQTWNPTRTTTTVPILAPAGDSVTPGLAFGTSGTGWSYDALNTRATLSTGGITRLIVQPSEVNTGTIPILTGSVTCTSLLSSGTVSCGTNGLTSGAITSSGAFTCGTNSLTCGDVLGENVFVGVGTLSGASVETLSVSASTNPLNLIGTTINCGTNPMTVGAITSSGTMSAGNSTLGTFTIGTGSAIRGPSGASGTPTYAWTSSNNSGWYLDTGTSPALSRSGTTEARFNGTTAAFTRDVTYPRYSLRLYLDADFSLPQAFTDIKWDAVETSGNVNFTYTAPNATITIPVTGKYYVSYNLVFTGNTSGIRSGCVKINGGGRRFGETNIDGLLSGVSNTTANSFYWSFTAGDTLTVQGFQNVTGGGNLPVIGLTGSGGGVQASTFQIYRVSE